MTSQHISPAVYECAASWLEQLSNGPLDKLSKRRFINWLDASPIHKQVFESMLATWSSPTLQQALADEQQKITLTERIRYTPRVRWWQAATLCTVLLLGLVTWQWASHVQVPVVHQYATHTGESRNVMLEDGSVVTLSAASDVFVNMNANHRFINLKKGAAYFDVASNKLRPFSVKIGTASVVAVGTEFSIDRGQHFTDVVVHEGAVEITPAHDRTPILLKAGEQVRIQGQTLAAVQQVDINTIVDWRSGWLELHNESLGYLVERLNREFTKPVLIDSPTLNNLPIAGRFRLNDPDQALSLLAAAYPISITETDTHFIINRQP